MIILDRTQSKSFRLNMRNSLGLYAETAVLWTKLIDRWVSPAVHIPPQDPLIYPRINLQQRKCLPKSSKRKWTLYHMIWHILISAVCVCSHTHINAGMHTHISAQAVLFPLRITFFYYFFLMFPMAVKVNAFLTQSNKCLHAETADCLFSSGVSVWCRTWKLNVVILLFCST